MISYTKTPDGKRFFHKDNQPERGAPLLCRLGIHFSNCSDYRMMRCVKCGVRLK